MLAKTAAHCKKKNCMGLHLNTLLIFPLFAFFKTNVEVLSPPQEERKLESHGLIFSLFPMLKRCITSS